MFGQHSRRNLRVLLDELEHRVGQDVRPGRGKVHERLEARVGLAQDAVAVPGHHTTRLERIPKVVAHVIVSKLGADLVLHGQDPAQDLLRGETVQWTGETQQTCTVAQEGIAERAADQVGGVRGDVASLVVAMKRQVETQQVVEVLVLLAALAQELGEVVRPVLASVQSLGTNLVHLVRAEDQRRDSRDLGQQRDAVVKGGLPVVGLAEALLVGLGELGLGVEGRHGNGQLGHGMHGPGEGLDQVQNMLRQVGLLGQLSRERADLVGRGDLARQEQPKHGLGEHLGA